MLNRESTRLAALFLASFGATTWFRWQGMEDTRAVPAVVRAAPQSAATADAIAHAMEAVDHPAVEPAPFTPGPLPEWGPSLSQQQVADDLAEEAALASLTAQEELDVIGERTLADSG